LKPNETREIPEYMKRLALAAYCTLAPDEEPVPVDNRDDVKRAIQRLVTEADPEKFNANGKPKIAWVRGYSGTDVSVALANEVFAEVMDEHQDS
jgi:hypothetical protein